MFYQIMFQQFMKAKRQEARNAINAEIISEQNKIITNPGFCPTATKQFSYSER